MSILLCEDTEAKRDQILGFLSSLGVEDKDITVAETLADFVSLFNSDVSICIIDLRIPAYEGADAGRNGLGILQAIERSGVVGAKLLAISSYPDEFEATRHDFERRGCMLVDFNKDDVWKSALKQMVIHDARNESYDFLIFTALRIERSPYTALPEISPNPLFQGDLSRLEVVIDGKKGAVVELPRMGIVDASATVARFIEVYSPRVVGMSGICAGVPSRAEMGQILIADLAYEYQSGKWTKDGFSQEPYQSPVSQNVRQVVLELLDDEGLVGRLEAGWKRNRPPQTFEPKLATFTSGSAVIADKSYMDQVANHHRRVSGLDMEVYAVFRAAQISRVNPEVICAKAVVDLADKDKDDIIQPYGAFVSARFLIEAIQKYFDRY